MELMYTQYLIGIKAKYKEILDLKEKLVFLINERWDFRTNNKNKSADIIIQWFTDEIEKITLIGQIEIKPSTSNTENQTTTFEVKNKNPSINRGEKIILEEIPESKKYEQSIRIAKIANQEDAERLGITQGEEYSVIPKPKNKSELFERFEKLHTQRYFETLKALFIRKYGEGNEKIIHDELVLINNFIEKANTLSTKETFENKWVNPKESDFYEYSRLVNNYYKNSSLPFSPYNFFNNNSDLVYARYFLYKDWLEQKLNAIQHTEKQDLINKVFINSLRLDLSTTNWGFDKSERIEIVPKELTHNYLLSNFNIDNSINVYYHLPTVKLLSDKEFEKMVKGGFVGKKETALRPYSNIIYGAYYSRSDLEWKLSGIAFGSKSNTIEGKEIKYFDDLKPYFKEYAKGFLNGFNDFDNIQIKPFLTMLAEKQDYINKVFEYITKNLFFKHGWATLLNGFTTNQNDEIVDAYENGQKQGYFYRAWSIVFSNNSLFAPLFQEFQKTPISQQVQTKTMKEPETENNLILSNIEDWLFPLKEETILTNTNYNNLVAALNHYFENGKFPKLDNQISVRKVNIKRFGWALNEIFRANTNNNENLPIDYLKFAKENISIFIDVSFDESNYLKSNLYKYFTTKTK